MPFRIRPIFEGCASNTLLKGKPEASGSSTGREGLA